MYFSLGLGHLALSVLWIGMFAVQKAFIALHYLLVLVKYIKEISSCENETAIFSNTLD